MLEASPTGPAAVSIDRGLTPDEMLAALRGQGGERFDPVRFSFIEGVARRMQTQVPAVRQRLDERLAQALADYGERFEQAQGAARDTVSRLTERFPEAAEELARLFAAGDFGGVSRCAAQLERNDQDAPLAELVRLLAQHSPVDGGGAHNANPGATAGCEAETAAPAERELKSLRYFRDTWSKLSVDQQLAAALAQGPENAGPLNSHLLVLKSLQRLRELSPDYLNRFMSYVDTLLWLDQASGGTSIRKNVTAGDSDKKRKPTRAKSK